MKITNKIQDIIEEIEYSMREERIRATTYSDALIRGEDLFVCESAKRRMNEMIQYIGGLSEALRLLGHSVTFDITNGAFDMVYYYNSVNVA